MDKWYIPVTFLPGISLLILSTSNIILALSTEINNLIEEHKKDHILLNKIKQLRLLTNALTGFYITAAAFVLSGGLGFLLEAEKSQIPQYTLYLGVLCTFVSLSLLIIYAYRAVSIRKQQFNHMKKQLTMATKSIKWYKVLDNKKDLPEGRVKTVTAEHQGICLTHYKGKFSALDNRCPHQGGPLGEGSIENGLLRCPWHGWDFDPCTGMPPGGYDDGVKTFEVKEEGDAIFVGVEEEAKHETTISDIMVETMVNWGVNRVFGMVGHSNLGVADALRRREDSGDLKFFGIRHEGAAAFAASAYGKLTGKPAACFTIAGPGATNLYTGLWDAKVDRAPLLALTGQVATQVVGTGAFQEVDLVHAFESVAPFNHRVEGSSKHSELMSLAVKSAIIDREVSHLTFPDDIQTQLAPKDEQAQTPEGRMPSFKIAPPKDAFDKAVNMLKASKRPVIIVGHGARFDMEAIIAFAESINAPVLTTFKGKGQIADSHPLGCGVLGRSGTPIASWFYE